MSLMRVNDRLLGAMEGPFFPEALEDLNGLYESPVLRNPVALILMGKSIPGYSGTFTPQTAGGYRWFRALRFERGDGRVLVCFPFARDAKEEDASVLDRSISFYSFQCSVEEMDVLCRQLIQVAYKLTDFTD